jgi:hypothetical protein
VFHRPDHSEVRVKDDLERVRDWAEARIKAGDVPDWSWSHHVELVEAIDAVLHDLSVSSAARPRRIRNLRLVERGRDRTADMRVTPQSLERRTGIRH